MNLFYGHQTLNEIILKLQYNWAYIIYTYSFKSNFMKISCTQLLIATLLVFSCTTKETTQEKTQSSQTQIQEVSIEEKKPTIPEPTIEEPIKIDSAVIDIVQGLDSTYSKTPYYFEKKGLQFFYVVNGTWKAPSENGTFPKGSFKMGITNAEGEVILPVEYDKIFSPDITAFNWVEIEQNGKYGLVNYQTGQIIPCEYDILFPSLNIDEYLVIGQKDGKLFSLQEDGKSAPIERKGSLYKDYVNKWKYDANMAGQPILVNCYNLNEYDGNGISYMPSFLLQLGFKPEVSDGYIYRKDDDEFVEFGTYTTINEIQNTRKANKNTWGVILSFFESVADARGGTESKSYHLTTSDNQHNLIDSKLILKGKHNWHHYFCSNQNQYSFLNDSLILTETIEDTGYLYPKYDIMLKRTLYVITTDGQIKTLDSNRFFEFTKYVRINEDYFQGCFTKNIRDDNYNLIASEHLDIEDLDIMRNEIFADYGYKFKTDKWANYFKHKHWYKPLYEDVTDQLTETDKANIEVILKVKKKLQENPDIINRHKTMFVAPG